MNKAGLLLQDHPETSVDDAYDMIVSAIQMLDSYIERADISDQ
jgi:hypothetical protein